MTNQTINKVITAANGLTVCAVSYPSIKTVSIRAIVFTGSIYETSENNGISHFLEHMMFRGNQQLGSANQTSLKIEELGGEINAATTFDMTEFWLDYHIDYLNQGIERFCAFMRYPLFEDIELEKSIILEEILSDYNEENQLIDIETITSSTQWPDHPMGLPVIGREQSVRLLTEADLRDWYHHYYQPGNLLVSITGDFDIDQVTDNIINRFEDLPYSKRNTYRPLSASDDAGNELQLVYDKDNQFRIEWAFNLYPLTSRTRIVFQLLRRILDDGSSSRLQKSIREEKGLVYDLSADMFFFNSGATFSIQSLVSKHRLEELIVVLVNLIQKLLKDGITTEEFELAKRRFIVGIDCNSDTAPGVLFESIAPLVYPVASPTADVFKMVREISLEELNVAMRRVFNEGRSCFVLVGPWEDSDSRMLHRNLKQWL